jgi:uncharacterized repeat protein (TIGR03803 family)
MAILACNYSAQVMFLRPTVLLLLLATSAAASTFATIASISGSTDAAGTSQGQVLVEGQLWGATSAGGSHGVGALYRIDPQTGAETVVWNFTGGADGAFPLTSLASVHGFIYGTADSGGANGSGLVFKFDPTAGALTALYNFPASHSYGVLPTGLTYANGLLYGETNAGPAGPGSIYSINPTNGAEAALYSFPSGNTEPSMFTGGLASTMLVTEIG